jgi:hypothetical protein
MASLKPPPPRLYLKPSVDIDATPPPLANHVRVLSNALDGVTVQAYFVSPTSVEEAANGWTIPGIRIEEDTAYVETTPAARVALPLSVAADLAILILKNVTAMGSADLVARVLENVATISEASKK